MRMHTITLSTDQLEDLAKICDAAKKQGEWELASLKRIFEGSERERDRQTLENFVAGCEAFAEMFRRSAK